MHRMLSHGVVIEDNWTVVTGPDLEGGALPAGDILLPLSYWLEKRDELLLEQADRAVGVWIDSHEEVETLANTMANNLSRLPVVAINFPKFVDGRGFSSARLLRDRYQYQGEIRAIGEFIRDQLFLMQRCGFSQFSFANDIDLQAAAASLKDFSEAYQTAADQPQPLFKRLR